MIKNNREVSVELKSENFKCLLGTMNRETPTVLYLKLSSWAEHNSDIHEYKRNITLLDKKIKHKIKDIVNRTNLFDPNIIFLPSHKNNLTKKDDVFHILYEVTLKQTCVDGLKCVDEICNYMNSDINSIVEILERSSNFEFQKRRRNFPPS